MIGLKNYNSIGEENLRVISGKAGGLRLKSIEGLATRPTADRIKESLFNIINPIIGDAQVLDLFAGTGALGIESLSRGAKFATFVDSNHQSISVIKYNLEHTKLMQAAEVYMNDYQSAVKKLSELGRRYDIVFIDPPYGKGLEYKAVEMLINFDILVNNSIIIIENEQKDVLPDKLYAAVKVDMREYGRTAISFYKIS